MTEPARDWRGTPITPGRTVVYGGPVGRSIQQVEGTVDGFTKSGRVNVRIVRRSYSSGTSDIVHVGPDRLTVVDSLPPSDVPTQAEVRAKRAEQLRVAETHDFPPIYLSREPWINPDRTCRRCGLDSADRYEKECASAVPE